MKQPKIKNNFFYSCGLVLIFVAMILATLPDNIVRDLNEFGANWGIWWSYFVDGGATMLAFILSIWFMLKGQGKL